MRKSSSSTSAAKKVPGEMQFKETIGKKLVQARLPFKTLLPSSSSSGAESEKRLEKTSETPAKQNAELRKRRLSYETEGQDEKQADLCLPRRCSLSKENLEVEAKRQRMSTSNASEIDDDVVVLLDETAPTPHKQLSSNKQTNCDTELSDKKRKGAGTPKNCVTKSGDRNVGKVQIKLPLSISKKNRRKKHTTIPKIDSEGADQQQEKDRKPAEFSNYDLSAVSDTKKSNGKSQGVVNVVINLTSNSVDDESINVNTKSSRDLDGPTKNESTSKMFALRAEKNWNEIEDIVDSDDETMDASVTNESYNSNDVTPVLANDVTPVLATYEELGSDASTKSDNALQVSIGSTVAEKDLTPKQKKLNERRRRAREEKERRLEEERQQKLLQKEEKELAKKREREERDEQRRREREEKDELRRKEREEKELKRQAEVDAKNEEKRKRNEAREEELRKREDERKRKEHEKEEAEQKKRKAAEGFKKFFMPKETCVSFDGITKYTEQKCENNAAAVILAFRPFQKRADMELAPINRKLLSTSERTRLDELLSAQTNMEEEKSRDQLYLAQLKSGQIVAGKWRKSSVDAKNDDDGDDNDDIFVVDELEGAGQAIVEETHAFVELHKAKFYKFYENRRPPYFGTWRKKTGIIRARRPFAQDVKYFDYEVDSDLEWEEEEPGESLDGSDDDKDKESEDEDYEVDNEWFVPHGHLSDEELQNQDEDDLEHHNDREAQKAKLKLLQQEFAQEMKKKTEKLKPRLLGCIWVDENGNQPELCPNIIWTTLNTRAMLCDEPPAVDEPEEPTDRSEPDSPNSVTGNSNVGEKPTEKLKPIVLSKEMLQNLVRLVHGNRHSKAFLINEFITFVEANEEAIKNGDVRGPLKSMVREKIDEFAEWQIIDAKTHNKKKNKKQLCWIVSKDVLRKMGMEDLSRHNRWEYMLQPKFTKHPSKGVKDNQEKNEAALGSSTNLDSGLGGAIVKNAKQNLEITQFTKLLMVEEKSADQQNGHVDEKLTTKTMKTETVLNTRKRTSDDKECGDSSGAATQPPAKKRIQPLMSVSRGQPFSTPTKNALISQFLTKSFVDKVTAKSEKTTTVTDAKPREIIELD